LADLISRCNGGGKNNNQKYGYPDLFCHPFLSRSTIRGWALII
jgi:hypothetical protein